MTKAKKRMMGLDRNTTDRNMRPDLKKELAKTLPQIFIKGKNNITSVSSYHLRVPNFQLLLS